MRERGRGVEIERKRENPENPSSSICSNKILCEYGFDFLMQAIQGADFNYTGLLQVFWGTPNFHCQSNGVSYLLILHASFNIKYSHTRLVQQDGFPNTVLP